MNAETLHAVAVAVASDFIVTRTCDLLNGLVDGLDGQVDNPGDPSFQQRVSDSFTDLQGNLESAPSNEFSPVWRDYLAEMGIEDVLGYHLAGRLEEIFARNQITVSVARDEVRAIRERFEQANSAVVNLIASLDWLHISPEVLEPGQYEVAITIPRGNVRNNLSDLGKEFEELAKLFGPLAELATGSRPPLELRSISSSDFGVVIHTAPEIVKLVTFALVGIVKAYKKVQGIRKAQEFQREAGLSEEILRLTEEQATEQLNSALDAVADKLMSENGANLVGEGRPFEIEMELKKSLQHLAYRYDHNVRIAIRAEPPAIQTTEGEGDGEPAPTPEMEIYNETIEAAQELEDVNLDGEPILMLPEETSADD